MKFIKSISLLLLLFAACSAYAQGPMVAVVSEMKAYAAAPTVGTLEMRISGRDAESIVGTYVTISGPCIPGGSYTGYVAGSRTLGDSPRVIISGNFPVLPALEDKSVFLEVSTTVAGRTYGDRVFYHWSSTVSTSNP